MSNPTFGVDGLLSTTIKKYMNKMEDIVFTSKPLLYILKQAGVDDQNGLSVVQPLLYGELNSKGSFAGEDTFAVPVASGITSAEFPWKQYYAAVKFSGIELAKNSGKEKIISLLEARLTQAELSISEDLNRMLFLDGTGNSGKDFDGLAAVVSASNTYAGIDRAANAYWRAKVTNTAANLSLAQMRKMYNDTSEGSDRPSHIVTTQAAYEAYEALSEGSIRHESTELADMGFDNLMFKSSPIVFDRATQAGRMYFLNTKYLKLTKLNGVWFSPTDWLVPVNQDAKYKNILLYGNLSCKNSSRQGVLTGISNG